MTNGVVTDIRGKDNEKLIIIQILKKKYFKGEKKGDVTVA